MNTVTEAAPRAAAGEAVAGALPALEAARALPAARTAAAGGWDPFEIWRTRVRDARREAPSPRRA